MTVLLIANVGNRDVWVDRSALIPGEVHPEWNKEASRRELGHALLQRWPRVASHLTLPIIGKAVEYVREQAGRLDRVVLVSSDQSGVEGTAERYLAQDTCEMAPVVERLLVERFGVPAESVEHWRVEANPSDYGQMESFFRQRLTALWEEEPGATIYLEVSGGTPAMTSMLLTTGAKILGLAARPLYVSERQEHAYPLNLGHRLVAASLLDVVGQNTRIYAYHAAAQTVRDNMELLRAYVPANDLLAILDYARQRHNFNFEEAWELAGQVAEPQWEARLRTAAQDIQAPTRETLLRESIFHARLAYENRNLLDFVVRVFQFAEGMWRYLALELGVEFEHNGQPNPDGKELAEAWKQTRRPLLDRLSAEGVKLETVNRYVLERLVTALLEERGQQAGGQTVALLRKLESVGDLRNRAVHQYHHLTMALLRDVYYPAKKERNRHPPEHAADILTGMEQAWETATQRPFDVPDPYRTVNTLCRDWIGFYMD